MSTTSDLKFFAEFASPGKTSNLVATSRDGSYTSRRTNSFAARNNSALGIPKLLVCSEALRMRTS